MKSPEEETLEQVRAISEGRAPKKYLRTEPLHDRVLVPRPAGEFEEELHKIHVRERQSVVALYDQFRQTDIQEFQSSDFARFCTAHGYNGDVTGLRMFISKRKAAGEIVALRREPGGFIFKFA